MTTYRKIQAKQVGNNFRAVTEIVTAKYDDLVAQMKPNGIIVKNHYVAINASDVNFTNGKYMRVQPPFDVGFESLGEIVQVGSKISKSKIGTYVAVMQYGVFSEYTLTTDSVAIPVPDLRPEYLGLISSGLTASIALSEQGRMTKGETVLVTAAAGGAGQIAVQLAKQAGNHVIGTCSSDEKAAMLKSMGCDRVINYKTEDFGKVLKKEYPRGVDIVFESVGGEFFNICLRNLAPKGRLLVIGTVASYSTEKGIQGDKVDTLQLLASSRTVAGFFMPAYNHLFKEHMQSMIGALLSGKLKVEIDTAGLAGLGNVVDGVEYLHKGKNKGKLVIPLLKSASKL
ncbi:hypothetical protein VKS41_001409 [Umbelopsis sp. WA50703]